MLGPKLCSGRKSSRVFNVDMSAGRLFEDFKNADGFGSVHSLGVTGFGGLPLFSLVNLARNSPTSHF